MSVRADPGGGSALLACAVRARRGEIERAIFARVHDGLSDPAGRGDAAYLAGLRRTVSAVLDYALTGIERGGARAAIPPDAVAQARRAARVGVGLDTVLRRYIAGYALLEGYIVHEAQRASVAGQRVALARVLETSALLLDRLIPAVMAAYVAERARGAGRATGAGEAAGRASGAGPGEDTGSARQAGGSSRAASAVFAVAAAGARARACLLFLAAQGAGGRAPSNREIARAIGVAHESQISRLLALLAEHDLVHKRGAGPGRRNSWHLTPAGEAAAAQLAAPRPGAAGARR